MIVLPKFKDIILPNVNVGVRYKGEYKIVMRDANGRYLYETGWKPNLITDGGLDNVAATSPFSYLCLGSDNTPANVADTALGSFMGVHSSGGYANTVGYTGSPNYGHWGIHSWRFNAGVATGTIQEMSLGPQNNGTDVTVRAVISPPIVKAADQIMDFYWRAYCYYDYIAPTYPTGTIDISGVTYNYEIRGSEVPGQYRAISGLASMGQVFACTGELVSPTVVGASSLVKSSGSASTVESSNTASYTPGTYQRTTTCFWGIGKANFDIRSFHVSGGTSESIDFATGTSRQAGHQVRIGKVSDDSACTKTGDQTFTIAFTKTWGRWP